MNHDAEYAAWQRQWQAGSEPDGARDWKAIKDGVARQSRRIRMGLAFPCVVTIGVGGYVVLRAERSRQLADAVLAIEGWVFIVVVWAVCLRLARGTWSPLSQTTAAYIDLAIRRCVSHSKGAIVGLWLYLAQLFSVSILLWTMGSAASSFTGYLKSWPVILLGWISLPAYLAWMLWFRRRRRTELARLVELRRQLTETDA